MLGHGGKAAPGSASVNRGDDDCGLASLFKGKIKMLLASLAIFRATSRRNCNCSDISARVDGIARGKGVVGVIADLMLDGVAGRIGKEHLPGPPGVAALPQGCGRGIDHLRVHWIECGSGDSGTEIEHMPGLAIVARDVTTGHIAVLHHKRGIVRADRRADRGAAAAGADYLPSIRIRPASEAGKWGEKQQDCKT